MNPKDKIHSSWKPILNILENDSKLKELNTKVLPNCTFYPQAQNIFNVFQMPVQEIKVVILGQDPYPNPGHAIGYAFAVSEQTNIPASLRIIKSEMISSSQDSEYSNRDNWKTLRHWTEQGVFLLNTALTVEHKKAGSHLKYWDNFTKEVIKFIATNTNAIFILWGKKAQIFNKYINNYYVYDGSLIRTPNVNYGLEAPHPAAEAYAGGKAGFYGCNHFNLVNEILESQGKIKINF